MKAQEKRREDCFSSTKESLEDKVPEANNDQKQGDTRYDEVR